MYLTYQLFMALYWFFKTPQIPALYGKHTRSLYPNFGYIAAKGKLVCFVPTFYGQHTTSLQQQILAKTELVWFLLGNIEHTTHTIPALNGKLACFVVRFVSAFLLATYQLFIGKIGLIAGKRKPDVCFLCNINQICESYIK